MPTIRCRPDGREVAAQRGATVLETLLAAGVQVTHACGGNARCSTCRVIVEDGACGPRTEDEAAMAARLGFEEQTRLSCQARVEGDVTVRRLVLDALDLRLAAGRLAAEAAVGREVFAAVLFADIVGFTPLSEAIPAYDVVHLLDRWFALAGPVVERNGGRIDNYMGDGLMAVFTEAASAPAAQETPASPAAAPPPGDDPAVAAVRAALGLVAAAAEMDRYARASWGRGFGVRVGVHCGGVVIGMLGAEHNRRETVIGDVVNVASRLEGENKALGTSVLVSQDVAARLGGRFRLGRTADLALKGKSAPQRVVEVVGEA
jgi:adenylate cyclase